MASNPNPPWTFIPGNSLTVPCSSQTHAPISAANAFPGWPASAMPKASLGTQHKRVHVLGAYSVYQVDDSTYGVCGGPSIEFVSNLDSAIALIMGFIAKGD